MAADEGIAETNVDAGICPEAVEPAPEADSEPPVTCTGDITVDSICTGIKTTTEAEFEPRDVVAED